MLRLYPSPISVAMTDSRPAGGHTQKKEGKKERRGQKIKERKI